MAPLLVVVSGYDPITRTLADALATGIPCPAICRDEIKEGLVRSAGDYAPERGDAMNRRTFETFFGVVGYLIDAGVSLVAEASFQHGLWAAGLEPLLDRADVRVVRCRSDAPVAWERIGRRADEVQSRRAIHGEHSLLEPFDNFRQKLADFQHIALDVPSIDVDTNDEFEPSIEEIIAFVNPS